MMTEDARDRRHADTTQDDIRELIMDMPEQKDKAILLILLRMAGTLDRNTEVMTSVSKKVDNQTGQLDAHIGTEKVMLGKAAGAWYVFSGVIVVAMGLAGVWFKSVSDNYSAVSSTVASHTLSISTIRKDIDLLQEKNRIEDSVSKGPR